MVAAERVSLEDLVRTLLTENTLSAGEDLEGKKSKD